MPHQKFNLEQAEVYKDITARCISAHGILSDLTQDKVRYCKLGLETLPCKYVSKTVSVMVRKTDEKGQMQIRRYPRCEM